MPSNCRIRNDIIQPFMSFEEYINNKMDQIELSVNDLSDIFCYVLGFSFRNYSQFFKN